MVGNPGRASRSAIVAFLLSPLLAVEARPAGPGPDGAAPCPLSMGRSIALPLRALDLAFVGPDRLVALDSAEAALFGLDGGGATLLGRASLPGPLEVVRAPGALLQASEADAAVWALTSRGPRAVLFAVEGGSLVEREQAVALPFAAAARGLRFRAGTNLIEGEVAGLGAGPFLDLVAADTVFAVSPEGRLLAPGRTDVPTRVGPTLAALWPGFLATSTASPPGEPDALVVIATDDAVPLMSCPVPGPVRAIAARLRGEMARVAVAVDAAEGRSSLLVVDVAHPRRTALPSATGGPRR